MDDEIDVEGATSGLDEPQAARLSARAGATARSAIVRVMITSRSSGRRDGRTMEFGATPQSAWKGEPSALYSSIDAGGWLLAKPSFDSSDERHVLFTSDASNLVAGDTNASADVFMRSLDTGVTSRVSVSSSGVQRDKASGLGRVSVSADGRFVAVESNAANLDPSAPRRGEGIYVRDVEAGVTRLASVTPSGAAANAQSLVPALSGDGRYVVFSSLATDLVALDTHATQNVYRRDLSTGVAELVSVGPRGEPADRADGGSSVSADGQRIAFTSSATNLVADPDFAPYSDVIVKDMRSGVLTRVSKGVRRARWGQQLRRRVGQR